MDPIIEDSVQCLLFPCITNKQNDNNLYFLKNMCEEINTTLKSLSQEYIWHKEEFIFNTPIVSDKNSRATIPPHLTSVTCFGDNIEDEWFILYLVLEITKIYLDVIVKVNDNDGEFILIEAADYLPQWANPVTTENRLFLYNGHIHLIPPEVVNLDIKLSIVDAIRAVIQSPETTRVIDPIEKAIFERISNYPQKIKENIHHAVVHIPIELATLLTLEPSFIAPIINTYCSHDPLEGRICRNIPINTCIDAKVKFTKCLYAMLVHSKSINNRNVKNNDTNSTKLGLKLSFGFNMILKSDKDMFATKSFSKFLSNLKDKGYFKGNIEGSQEYNKLLEEAKAYFSNNDCSIYLHISKKMKQLMSTDKFIKLKETIILNNENSQILSGDCDDWLNIHPDELNELLNKRYGKQVKYKKDDLVTAQTITNDLNIFLNKSSDLDGIETSDDDGYRANNIEFEADKFSECIEHFLNFIVSNNQEIDSNESDDYDYIDEIPDDNLDKEIKEKLLLDVNSDSEKTIVQNIIQSVKEENSTPGPSSTLLRNLGIKKSDLLDSDDDEE